LDSKAALALRRKFRPPCPLTPLHRLELQNAWRLKVFRKELSRDAAEFAADDLQADIDTGVWQLVSCDLAAVFHWAERLSQSHTAVVGSRSLDILHVAFARELGITNFVTGDDRQARLAAAVGLKLTRLG
jgi:predicted nucleic acid-binding protein